MCVGDVSTQPTGAPYPACASGFSTRSVTPGALRALSTCWKHVASNPARIEFVPMTVMGLPLSPGAGIKPVASPVAWIWIGLLSLMSNAEDEFGNKIRRAPRGFTQQHTQSQKSLVFTDQLASWERE